MPKVGMEPVRRQALISAVIDTIHDRGLGQVTMGEIARRAGVSAGLAHHYFGNKDQLLMATMRHLLSELGNEIQQRLATAETAPARIRAIVSGNFSACQFRPAVISAWLAFYVQAQTDAETHRLLRIYQRRLESNLLHALQDLVSRDQAVDVAEMAASLIDGVWIRRSLAGQSPDPDSAVVLVETTIFNAISRCHA